MSMIAISSLDFLLLSCLHVRLRNALLDITKYMSSTAKRRNTKIRNHQNKAPDRQRLVHTYDASISISTVAHNCHGKCNLILIFIRNFTGGQVWLCKARLLKEKSAIEKWSWSDTAIFMGFMYKKKMLSFEIKNNVEQPRAATQISSFSAAILSLDMILTAIPDDKRDHDKVHSWRHIYRCIAVRPYKQFDVKVAGLHFFRH